MWHNANEKRLHYTECLLCAKHDRRKKHFLPILGISFHIEEQPFVKHPCPFSAPLLMIYLTGKLMQEVSSVVEYPPPYLLIGAIHFGVPLCHRFFKDRPPNR